MCDQVSTVLVCPEFQLTCNVRPSFAGKELLEDANTGDKTRLRGTLADTQARWHDFTELLVQMISFSVSPCVISDVNSCFTL